VLRRDGRHWGDRRYLVRISRTTFDGCCF
jgi:hypothetical protein